MGFSRQEYWSGLPFPSPGDLPDPRIKPGSLALEADALTSEPPGKPTPLNPPRELFEVLELLYILIWAIVTGIQTYSRIYIYYTEVILHLY